MLEHPEDKLEVGSGDSGDVGGGHPSGVVEEQPCRPAAEVVCVEGREEC